MKRVLAFILAALMCFSLCACEKEAGGPVTLKVYMPADPQSDFASVLAEVNKITEAKIGAKVDIQFIDQGAYTEKMNMIMASGEAYDICFTGYLNKYSSAVSKGGLMCLDDLLDTVPTLKESVPDYLWDSVKYYGSIYAVPNEQIVATKNVSFTFKDLADKYGLDVDSITHMSELEPYLAKVKAGEPNMIPFRLNSGMFTISDDPNFKGFEEIVYGVGFRIGDPEAKIEYVYDSPEYQAGVARRNEWLKKGYIREDILSAGDDTIDYKSGRYAVWNAVYKPGVEADFTKQFGREVVAMKNIGTPYVTQSSCSATMLALGRNCKNPELAIKLIELLNTDKELYNLISYGIEGKHYELTEDGKARKIDDSGYKMESWKWGNQFNAHVLEGAESTVWEETKEMNDSAEKSVLINFVLDKDPIASELANLTSVTDEYQYVIQGYTPDYKDFEPAYRAKLAEVGLDTIITEMQRQVDECLAANK